MKESDQRKSVLLARAMGLDVRQVVTNPFRGAEEPAEYCDVIFYNDEEGYRKETTDFYSDHLEVTWLVLNWAAREKIMNVFELNIRYFNGEISIVPAQEMQRKGLDAIFEWAVEAGKITLDG